MNAFNSLWGTVQSYGHFRVTYYPWSRGVRITEVLLYVSLYVLYLSVYECVHVCVKVYIVYIGELHVALDLVWNMHYHSVFYNVQLFVGSQEEVF